MATTTTNTDIPEKYATLVEYYRTLLNEGVISLEQVPEKIRQYL